MTTKIVEVGPKLYLNGFPKSGTHLLASMASSIMRQANTECNWMGNIGKFAFSNDMVYEDAMLAFLADFPERRYIKGHLGYNKQLAEVFTENHWCKVFIFRDFRDVAVSAAYHAKKDTKGTNFPEKDLYLDMEIDDLLKIIIAGDENVTGVMERWELYAPWLDEDWVLKFDYGDVLANKEIASEMFIRYLFGRLGNYLETKTTIEPDYFDTLMHAMMDSLNNPEKWPTYRNGKTGDWKEHFTNEHKRLFKESDKNNWLTRLGYTNDRNW